MNEFRIHHDVNELLSLLHVRGGDGAEGYIDLLQKHRTPYVTTTVSAHSAKVGLGPDSTAGQMFWDWEKVCICAPLIKACWGIF